MKMENKAPNMKTMNPTALLLSFMALLLSGCSSVMNIGEPDFACPTSNTSGLGCMGVRDLYKATDGPLDAIGKGVKDPKGKKLESTKKLQPVTEDASFEPSPWMDKPFPIRSQAKVMRIWIAPFEDESSDLNAPGLVYTEIESRRWNVGEGLVKRPSKLTPVQVSNSSGQENTPTNPFGVTNGSGQAVKALVNQTGSANKGSPQPKSPQAQPGQPGQPLR